jgi:hypothetical protein
VARFYRILCSWILIIRRGLERNATADRRKYSMRDLNHPRQSRHFRGIPFMCRGFSDSGGPPAKAAKMRASRLRSLCFLILLLASSWAWPLDPDKHISQNGAAAKLGILPSTLNLKIKQPI